MGYVVVLLIFLKYIIAVISVIAIIVLPFIKFATGKRYLTGLVVANLLLWIQVFVFFKLDIISYSFLEEFYINAVISILILVLYLVKYVKQNK